jgi:hypothetical protein
MTTTLTRFLCGSLALSLMCTSHWALAQSLSPAGSSPDSAGVVQPTPAAATDEVAWPAPDASLSVGNALSIESAPRDASSPSVISATPTDVTKPPPALRVTYSQESLSGAVTRDVMDSLRVVRQQATKNALGQQIAINAALILLTGGMALNIRGFGKEDFAGIAPEGAIDTARLKNPASVQLTAELERRAALWLASQDKTRDMSFNRSLVVNSATWRLVYNSLDEADSSYRLQFDAEIFKSRETPSFFTGPKRGGKACSYQSDVRPMAEWKAGDYQAVVDLIPQAVAYCADAFAAQLPDLLELQ